jgi:hypothetical protein
VYLTDKSHKVHRLVAVAFVPHKNVNDNIVNHIDGNKLNNNSINLEWTTIAVNNKHAYDIGLNKRTVKKVCQMNDKLEEIRHFKSVKEASDKTNICETSIIKACRGIRKYAGKFKWKYDEETGRDENLNIEDFVDIKDFPKYCISKEGHIYNKSYKQILKVQVNGDGYKVVSLAHNTIKKSFLVHRLVAIHFIENSENKQFVNHIDGNKLNCNYENLEWVTSSENSIHSKQLQISKLVLKNANGLGEKSRVQKKHLKIKENPQPSP